jgi:MFS family permease
MSENNTMKTKTQLDKNHVLPPECNSNTMKTKTQLDKNHVLPPLRHLVLLSLSFFTLFVAFTPSQSYAVVIFGNFGVLGVIILYTCFCLTNLVAPYVVKRLGITFALTLGAMGYLPFVLALAVNSEIVFILGSVTCGGGAALLWVSIGCAVTLLSNPSTRGRRFGLFSFCNRLNFVGNLIAGILFSAGSIQTQVFWYLFVVSCVACLLLAVCGACVLVPLERAKISATTATSAPMSNNTTCATIFQIMCHHSYIPFLCTNFVSSGFVRGWVFAVLTTWAPNFSDVGYMMTFFGASIVVSGPIHGWLFDCVKSTRTRTSLLLITNVSGLLGVACVFHFRFLSSHNIAGYLVGACFFGFMTGGGEAVVNAGTSYLFPEKTSAAFAAKLLIETFGQVCGYLIVPIFGQNYIGQLVLLLSVLCCSGAIVVYYTCCRRNAFGNERGKEMDSVVVHDS